MLKLLVKKLSPRARLPQYMSQGASGLDIFALLDDPIVINPMRWVVIPTGIAVAIPPGYEAQIRPRSGLALQYGVTVLNSPGTIDSDYRGEIKVILINLGEKPFLVKDGDRIAQMVIQPVKKIQLALVQELPPSGREEGGFGHTGR